MLGGLFGYRDANVDDVCYCVEDLLFIEPWAANKKSFKLVWRCHQLLSGFLTKDHLPRVSHQLANDKDDNEIIPGLCTNFLEFTLQPRENPENHS